MQSLSEIGSDITPVATAQSVATGTSGEEVAPASQCAAPHVFAGGSTSLLSMHLMQPTQPFRTHNLPGEPLARKASDARTVAAQPWLPEGSYASLSDIRRSSPDQRGGIVAMQPCLPEASYASPSCDTPSDACVPLQPNLPEASAVFTDSSAPVGSSPLRGVQMRAAAFAGFSNQNFQEASAVFGASSNVSVGGFNESFKSQFGALVSNPSFASDGTFLNPRRTIPHPADSWE